MTEPVVHLLKVPGATLRYEVRGTGPVLLLIAGGGGDAGIFEPVAEALADRFTVVTYDPRGHSRSPLDGPDVDQCVGTQAEDAYRLLDRVAPEGPPAYVFGTSSGAIVAVELLTRHPDRLAKVVAHEPVLVSLLPDAADQHAFFGQVVSTFHRAGVGAAMAEMGAGCGEERGEKPDLSGLSPRMTATFQRVQGNAAFFLGRILGQFSAHVPDLAQLDAHAGKLVPAAGWASYGLRLYRPAAWLAERYGVALAEFPGGHVGVVTHPGEFALELGELLR
ncbi:alpha/beta hydrolase [Streptomyces xanthochromogenes]|uniref:Alpha/beta hydrolase n=1 Tax=Streptomyces xanthochromogenes TaxID=67384 RepID=A0ABQ3B1C0_9ACTN|nr:MULTISPECIES: alpha/beta hydrolase [Streptomyces]MYV90773.1 alpha/beta fold hydrolase [Streptomyces sp. SID1034]GGY72339.1 alpha/beta hydrolase [Streptomyces xanthochromogenes]